MATTPSTMLPLGTIAPPFTLPDTISGKMKTLKECKSDRATVIMFICNHCPYVIHIKTQLVALANDYLPHGVSFIAISANDAQQYPQDGPDEMKKDAATFGYPFPYLHDETQTTAKAYNAACTPDFFIFDGGLKLVYRGQFDDSRPGRDTPVTGQGIRSALDNILAGQPVDANQKPSMGCNIKWKI